MITHGVNGLLTTPRSSGELANAIGQLLKYEPLRQRFIQASLKKAFEYSWPHVASQVLDYYAELIEEQRNPTGRKIYG